MAVEIAANIRRGNIIEYTDGQLYSVLKAESFRPGKGTPTTTIEMRRISDGIKIVNTYKTTDKLEKAFVEDIGYTYLYQDGDNHVFMHPETFEQVYVSGTMLGDNAAFLQENMEVNLQMFNGEPVSATLPARITAMRSLITSASSWSCVTYTNVIPSRPPNGALTVFLATTAAC